MWNEPSKERLSNYFDNLVSKKLKKTLMIQEKINLPVDIVTSLSKRNQYVSNGENGSDKHNTGRIRIYLSDVYGMNDMIQPQSFDQFVRLRLGHT